MHARVQRSPIKGERLEPCFLATHNLHDGDDADDFLVVLARLGVAVVVGVFDNLVTAVAVQTILHVVKVTAD